MAALATHYPLPTIHQTVHRNVTLISIISCPFPATFPLFPLSSFPLVVFSSHRLGTTSSITANKMIDSALGEDSRVGKGQGKEGSFHSAKTEVGAMCLRNDVRDSEMAQYLTSLTYPFQPARPAWRKEIEIFFPDFCRELLFGHQRL